jgi:RHS repeat-associated protein
MCWWLGTSVQVAYRRRVGGIAKAEVRVSFGSENQLECNQLVRLVVSINHCFGIGEPGPDTSGLLTQLVQFTSAGHRFGLGESSIQADSQWHTFELEGLSDTEFTLSIDGMNVPLNITEEFSAQEGNNWFQLFGDPSMSIEYIKIWEDNFLSHDYVAVGQGSMLYSPTPAPSNCMWNKATQQYETGGGSFSIISIAPPLSTPTNTISYTYSDPVWKDKLSSYNGQTITYDVIGNPLSYRDGMSFIWQQGRQLGSMTTSSGQAASFTYNPLGTRISKTVAGVTTSYLVDEQGSIQIIQQGNDKLVFMYDSSGRREGFIWYTGSTVNGYYYYLYNAQSDVIGIVNNTMTPVAFYEYDAWGKPTNTTDGNGTTINPTTNHIANINPFRYRSYAYDQETGLYYLNSRYYDPETGRFVNADDPHMLGMSEDQILGTNLFAYSNNSPVSRFDPTGYLSIAQLAARFVPAAIMAVCLAVLYANYGVGLVTVGGYSTSIVAPVAIKFFWWKPVLAAAIIIGAVAVIVAAVVVMFAKASKLSAAERAKDKPSWMDGAMSAKPPRLGEKAQDYAKRLLDSKYGAGKWDKSSPEYSKMVKFLQRHHGMK